MKVHNRMVGLAINTSELWKENEDWYACRFCIIPMYYIYLI